MRFLVPSLLALSVACGGGTTLGVRVQPINSYRAYGEYHAVAEDDAVVKKAAAANPEGAQIRIFQEALPAGIRMSQSTLEVERGYRHRLIGKYAFSSGKEESKDFLVTQVRKMCITTGANAALILFQLVPNEHQDRAQGIEAVLVDLHADEPTAPAPSEPAGDVAPNPKSPTIASFVMSNPAFSQFTKLVERCGSMSVLDRNEGLAPLLLNDEAFARISPAEKQRLESDLAYCKQVVACHIAGFDCVAAVHPEAKLAAGLMAPRTISAYFLAEVDGFVADAQTRNGVPLMTSNLLSAVPASTSTPLVPGKISQFVAKDQRVHGPRR